MSFKADSVDDVLEFTGLEVLQREGNSTEVPKCAKGDGVVGVVLSKVLLQVA